MNKFTWRDGTLTVLLSVALGILGLVAALWLFGKYSRGDFARWHSVGAPPEQAVKILGFDPSSNKNRDAYVYVETTTDKVYTYPCCSLRDAMWQEVELAEDPYYFGVGCFGPYDRRHHPYFANLPAEVVDCQVVNWSWEWFGDISYFVLLDDGTIWWWRDEDLFKFGMFFVFIICGIIIGIMLGISLSVYILNTISAGDKPADT